MSTTSCTLREASLACGNPYGVRSSTASTHYQSIQSEILHSYQAQTDQNFSAIAILHSNSTQSQM
jgi:hypothetical protein